jgi:hypothetical protein
MRSLVVFGNKKVGFKKNSKELFFWWCGMGCLKEVDGYVFIIFSSFLL